MGIEVFDIIKLRYHQAKAQNASQQACMAPCAAI